MQKNNCPECEEPDDMMTTYADAITLLMAFFVMLLTFSEYDVPAYQEAAAAIANEIGHGEKDAQSDTQTLKIDVEDIVFEMQADQVVDVKLDTKGVDAIVASACVQMPSLPAIEVIESVTGIPTLSASVATTWSILQALGLKAIAPGGGTLLKTDIKNTKE